MAHLTNFSIEFFYEIFTKDASPLLLYHDAKKSKMTKTQIKGPALKKTGLEEGLREFDNNLSIEMLSFFFFYFDF